VRRLIALFFLLAGIVQAQNAPPHPPHFGLTLSPKSLELWNEISRRYGKPIDEETMDFSWTNEYGRASVDPYGTPMISLSEPGREEYLVHELMHLKLLLEGYPERLVWSGNCPSDEDLLGTLSMNLKDIIEHWIFTPQMLAMGLAPDPEITNDIMNAIQQDRYRGGDDLPVEALASFYFRSLTLPNQSELTDQLAAWYRRKGWTEALDLGNQMFAFLNSVRPTTAGETVAVFLQCANILFRDRISFNEDGWEEIRRGNVVLRTVSIEMIRIGPCTPYPLALPPKSAQK
jgi:hypothetical protein